MSEFTLIPYEFTRDDYISSPVKFQNNQTLFSKFNTIIQNQQNFEDCNLAMKELHVFIQNSPQWMEPYFFSYLPILMDNMGSYKTGEQAKETGVAI